MKKLFVGVVLFWFVLLPNFSQESEVSKDIESLDANIIRYVQLDLLSELKFFKTEKGIKEMSLFAKDLDPFYKDILYKRYSKDPWKEAAVNLLTGGMGSILAGNWLSGIVVETGMLVSYVFGILTITTMDVEMKKNYFLISEIGAVVFGLVGIVLPFVEDIPCNNRLKRAYLID